MVATWMYTSVKSQKLQASKGAFIVYKLYLNKTEFTKSSLWLQCWEQMLADRMEAGDWFGGFCRDSGENSGGPAEGAEKQRELGWVLKQSQQGLPDLVLMKCEGDRCSVNRSDRPLYCSSPSAPVNWWLLLPHLSGPSWGQGVGWSD